ncbi:lantibiotic dehydratase C-terminal domain-containing protein [Streptosporangium sp. NPDC000396]|uniref:lantibiotic dehydratase C-terminal domain-containing protein n=1 Tax=Streptosporangium sp. NPDC000396 TaxID=3366185 RepID=UPI0036AD7519
MTDMRGEPRTDLDVACYYHTPTKAALLHEAVLPAIRDLQGRGFATHVERHWLHGPHLRIRLSGSAGQVTEAAEALAGTLREHLLAHPSQTVVDTAVLLERSVINGRAELILGPYEPIHPDNTVRIEPADASHLILLLGSEAAVAHRATLLRAGLEPVATSVALLVRHGNSTGDRVQLALTAMAVHAAAYPAGYAGGYQSFLSHLEDFLHLNDADGRLRARFDHEWRQRTELITEQVGELVAFRPADPVARVWAEWARTAWQICGPAFERGELPSQLSDAYRHQALATGDEATARRWDPGTRTSYSEYHRLLRRTDFLRLPGVEGNFGPYRFATNVFYLLLKLCDVTPLERYLAAYLFSQAAQRLSGVTWQEAIASHLSGDAPIEVSR